MWRQVPGVAFAPLRQPRALLRNGVAVLQQLGHLKIETFAQTAQFPEPSNLRTKILSNQTGPPIPVWS